VDAQEDNKVSKTLSNKCLRVWVVVIQESKEDLLGHHSPLVQIMEEVHKEEDLNKLESKLMIAVRMSINIASSLNNSKIKEDNSQNNRGKEKQRKFNIFYKNNFLG